MSKDKRTYSKVKDESAFYKDSVSGLIYYIKSHDGKVIKFSCKTNVLKTAKAYANKELRKRLGKTTAHVTPLLEYWIDRYIKERESDGDISDSARRNSVNALKKALGFWGKKRHEQISKESLSEFYDWHKAEWPDFQFENTFKYFRNFMNWLADERYQGKRVFFQPPKFKNPEAKQIRKLRKEKKERVFSKSEVRKILAACDDRQRLLVLLMYTMAFRVESDALSAKWAQFRMDDENPIYVFGEFDNKAGLEGRQAIHPEVLTCLKDWQEVTGHSKYVFPQKTNPKKHIVSQMINWDKVKEASGVKWDWTPHFFRHTCLTRLAEKGFPMHLICKCYRISPQEFMETYAHLTPEGIEQMRAAIDV